MLTLHDQWHKTWQKMVNFSPILANKMQIKWHTGAKTQCKQPHPQVSVARILCKCIASAMQMHCFCYAKKRKENKSKYIKEKENIKRKRKPDTGFLMHKQP